MAARHCVAGKITPQPAPRLPAWVPVGARLYLSHVAEGQSLRALGRDHGCHASTVLRQIRHFENRRDDPLVDTALRKLDHALRACSPTPKHMESRAMISRSYSLQSSLPDASIEDGAIQALHHLVRPKALLIVAEDMPKSVVTCEKPDGTPERLAVVDRSVAEAMALNGWITCCKNGRISSYAISSAGRLVLRQQTAQTGVALAAVTDVEDSAAARRMRYGTVESPVAVLARRRDKNGKPFLDSAQVQAADWLREDFVRAQLEPVPIETVQALLVALETRKVPGPNIALPGTKAARSRVHDVLRDLGPGLGDVALRCCCRLEGVEAAEQALGWSARSGKIVLRIALQRITDHYKQMGDSQMMIG